MKNIYMLILLIIMASGCQSNDYHDTLRVNAASLPMSESAGASDLSPADQPAIGAPEGIINLEEALSYALVNHPDLAVYSWELRAAEARELQAGLRPNPELEFEMEEFGGTGAKSDFKEAETSMRLSQTIELGGKRQKRMQAAKLFSEAAEREYRIRKRAIIASVRRAFLQVLYAQEKGKLSAEKVTLSQEVLRTVSRRVEAGKDSPPEQTKAEVALAKEQTRDRKEKSQLCAARSNLIAAWGGNEASIEGVRGNFDQLQNPPRLNDLQKRLADNPAIARGVVEIERHKAVLALEEAGAVPDPILGGGVQYIGETDDSAFIVSVGIPLPLSNRNQGEILAAKYELARSKSEYAVIGNQVNALLTDAWYRLDQAVQEAADIRDRILPGAQKVYGDVLAGYQAGKFDYLTVLDAQRTLFELKENYLETLYNYHNANIDIEQLLGRKETF